MVNVMKTLNQNETLFVIFLSLIYNVWKYIQKEEFLPNVTRSLWMSVLSWEDGTCACDITRTLCTCLWYHDNPVHVPVISREPCARPVISREPCACACDITRRLCICLWCHENPLIVHVMSQEASACACDVTRSLCMCLSCHEKTLHVPVMSREARALL